MKYRFDVIYTPQFMQDVVEFLRVADLDVGELGMTDVVKFTSEKNVPISELKQKLTQAYESINYKVLQIEGGVIE